MENAKIYLINLKNSKKLYFSIIHIRLIFKTATVKIILLITVKIVNLNSAKEEVLILKNFKLDKENLNLQHRSHFK